MEGQILVVDGTATNRITLKVRLAAACYDPLTARTGAEALGILARCRPSMVLIGGSPGDMDAIELCARIGRQAPGLPVVMAVPQHRRIAALQAGAEAVLDLPLDDGSLFARIRGLMRDRQHHVAPSPGPGLAEEQQAFLPAKSATAPTIMLIASDLGVARGWRQALAPRLSAQFRLADPERALAEGAIGLVPDLYLIAADMVRPGDGLRLLSELRSRRSSRNAAFAVAFEPDRQDMMSVALDLGAGDALPSVLGSPEVADEAALRLTALIRHKMSADGHRAAEERERSFAWTDPLTGLPNRRFALPRLVEFCRGGQGSCAVVAIDIDRFKEVNDCHGHAAGDAVLAEVAARLDRVVPAHGFVARVGGEEFLAVLPDTSEATAAALTQHMRALVSGTPIPLPGREAGIGLRITISAGVAGLKPGWQDARTRAEDLLQQADHALLRAKRSGRDQVMISGVGAAA
ncbi:diguanylate cyclase [Paracoccus chinensis]|uniref:diguanylate cyclase n=1 Tax=Paracoccus chinensis TaxID=525640 RepID=A0A1G9ELS1_9RHOB|nr:diguanylate cyclase [Paracoccus chinensis]SDK77132.1 two-component system, cell cycle response regulator [Paracoccus chinensis]